MRNKASYKEIVKIADDIQNKSQLILQLAKDLSAQNEINAIKEKMETIKAIINTKIINE